MRFRYAIFALALLCLAPPVPAQLNTNQPFPSLKEQSGARSWIGVVVHDIDAERARAIKLGEPRGVEVVGVPDGGPAEQAGIKIGDLLFSYNGEPIVGAQQLGRLVAETPQGRRIKVEYWREGKTSTTTLMTAGNDNSALVFNLPQPNFSRLDVSFPIPAAAFVWINSQLGVECEALNSHDPHDAQFAEFFGVGRGVLVRFVAKDSPAARAGIHAGDVITQIGDRSVGDPKDIWFYLRQERPASKFPVELMRDHKTVMVKMALLQEPQE